MRRRGFFKTLGLLAAGFAVAPSVSLANMAAPKKRFPVIYRRARLNPAYVEAKYELQFLWSPHTFKATPLLWNHPARRLNEDKHIHDPWPIRGNEILPNGFPKSIPPFIFD